MINIALLPYASFHKSVECYSDATLFHTLSLLLARRNCISRSSSVLRYREREMWILWHEAKQAYIRLTMMCVDEANLRNIPYDRDIATCLFRAKRGKHWPKPLWVNWESWHSSNRAALLQMGAVEQLCQRIISWKGKKQWAKPRQWAFVTDWLSRYDFTTIAEGDERFLREVHNYLTDEGAPLVASINPYDQFNWTERPCGRITSWPPEPGESWLCEV